jgi:hypothetical protein
MPANNFSSTGATNVGWAAFVEAQTGTTCLDFTHNSAIPTDSPAPYSFAGMGGTFNLTNKSNTTNSGTINQMGTTPVTSRP